MLGHFVDATAVKASLRCPDCGGNLDFAGEQFSCATSTCQSRFPVLGGVPVLLAKHSMFRIEDFLLDGRTTFSSSETWSARIGRLLPSPSRDVGAPLAYPRMASLLNERELGRRRVLVIGSGDGTASYRELSDVEQVSILETDVSMAGSAKIVCDATGLPFESGSFDLVLCQAVLEHVLEPERVVEEIHRVLSEDGLVYAATPFMQQVHMGAYDFTRFSRSGHRWLFRRFEEIASGVATGPASVLVWSIEYFGLAWTSRLWIRRSIKAATRLMFGWLTMLDNHFRKREPGFDGAGGFYFLGRRRPNQVITARDMVFYYRGADAEK